MSGATAAHGSRARQYLAIFAALFLLTVVEVGVAYVQGHRPAVMFVLFALAVVKAACVALFFMHLKWETRVLRGLVVVPLMFPVLYALVLITEGIWRRLDDAGASPRLSDLRAGAGFQRRVAAAPGVPCRALRHRRHRPSRHSQRRHLRPP
jgi:cytochrome c oxidase subunit IV